MLHHRIKSAFVSLLFWGETCGASGRISTRTHLHFLKFGHSTANRSTTSHRLTQAMLPRQILSTNLFIESRIRETFNPKAWSASLPFGMRAFSPSPIFTRKIC